MYLPVIFSDDDPDLGHPLVAFNTDGREFDSSDLTGAVKTTANKKGKPKGDFEDAIEFLKAPVEGITMKIAKNMLDAVDPDLPYMEWLNVCLALRHQFYSKQENNGFELFDEWSSTGSKYAGTQDTKAKWDSCKPHAASRYPVTIRSLMQRAEEDGWDSSSAVQDAIDRALDFVAGCKTPREILSKGLKEIARVPLISPAEDDLLLNATHQSLKEMSYKVSLPALRQELKKVRAVLKFKAKDGKMPSWAKGLVYVTSINSFFRPQTRESFTPESLDNAYSRHLMGEAEEATRSDVRPRDLLLNQIKVPVVYDFAYNPAEPNETIVTRDKQKLVNSYIRSYPDPNYKMKDEAGKLILEHTKNIIAEKEYARTFIDWLAFLVQHPGQKIRWSPLIQGGHGCGKSFFDNLMRAVLGAGNVNSVDASVLVNSAFNEWAEGSQLVVFEEIRLSGHNRLEVMDRLKPIIANSNVSINQKYRNIRVVPNVTNYMALTNYHDAAVVSDEDRRWFFVKCKTQTKAQVQALSRLKDGDYFKELFKLTEGKLAAAARAFFEEWEISDDFDPEGHAPRTTYFYELVANSTPQDVQLVADLIANKEHKKIGQAIIGVKHLQDMLDLEGETLHNSRVNLVLTQLGYKKVARINDGETRQTWYINHRIPMDEARGLVTDLIEGDMTQDDIMAVY